MNKICLKIFFTIPVLIFYAYFGFSQSKKNQIQVLTYKLDSLQAAHDLTSKAYVDSIQSLRNEVKTFVEKVGFFKSEIEQKEFELKRNNNQINDYKNEIRSLKNEILNLNKKVNSHENSTLPEFLMGKIFKFECKDEDEKYVLAFTEENSKINTSENGVFISGYEMGGEIIRTVKSDENLYNVYFLNNTEYEYSEKVQLITFEIIAGKILYADHLLTNCQEENNDASSIFGFEEEIIVKEKINEGKTIVDNEFVNEPVFDFPDVEAAFEGGEKALVIWMEQNLKYPEVSMEMGEQGKVYLKFVVEKDGSLTNIEVINGVSRDLNNEAIRIVAEMPNWIPGENKGQKVRSYFLMPINFELN